MLAFRTQGSSSLLLLQCFLVEFDYPATGQERPL
jgi:hypothetical protein